MTHGALKKVVIGMGMTAMVAMGHHVMKHKIVLYAQTLPSVKHATWIPNPASQNVTQYVVTLDSGTPTTVLASSCTATLCTGTIAIPAFGNHSISVTAQNLALSTDPTSLQSGPAAAVSFSLNQGPSGPSGANVTN